jgi:hypothetical protein
MIRISIAACLAALATASAAMGAEQGGATAETVVVTATRDDPATLDADAARFVEARTALTPIKQVARWQAPLCVSVQGLPPAYDAFIAARIRAVAAKVGAPVDKSCKPNVEVMFTPDPQKMASDVADRSPWLFGAQYATDAKRHAIVSHPIQPFYVTATLDPQARQRTDAIDNPTGVMGDNRKVEGSRLGEKKRSVFENVLIVADSAKMGGADVGTVADYMAVLALSQVQVLESCAPLVSVADALASSCARQPAPVSITDADVAFLSALYTGDPEQLGSLARSDIARRTVQTLAAH